MAHTTSEHCRDCGAQTETLRAFADWPDPMTRAEMAEGGDA